MSKVDESIGFYRKMSELQERLRISEEERLQLEEKFSLLMTSCRDEEEARLNNLRERYEAFLEEEKQRRERNDRILQALDRIESRTAILTAKSERLKILRRHYEAYMLKMYPNWRYVNNKFTGDQPSTRKSDPLLNKFNLEMDRNSPYRGLGSSLFLFPEEYNRSAAPTLHQDYSTVGVIPASYQPVSAHRTTVDTAPTTKPVDGPPLPSAARHMINVVDTEKIPSIVVTTEQHSSSQKALPIYTHKTSVYSQNSATDQVESNKIDQLDDYLGRAAEMLQLSRGEDNLRDTRRCFSEINPDSLKDTKNLGNSVDFELEQNTSGDLLNVSLSDDGVLQEETSRTLISQKGDEDKDISQTEQVNINSVNNKDRVMNKNAQHSENIDNESILLNKEVQDLHQESKPHLEQKNQETVKGGSGDAQSLMSALAGKDEFDKQQQLHQKNSTLKGAGDSVIPDKSLYLGGALSETEGQSGLSQMVQRYSTLNDAAQNFDKTLNVERKLEDVDRNMPDSSGSAYINEADASETPVSESQYRAEGGQPNQQYEAEQPGDTEFTEQRQSEEDDQQHYQQYTEQQEGDQYYLYGDDEMYQQNTEGEYGQNYDELYVNQEGEQYYQQYAEQVEGQYGYQNGEQYSQQYGDQEGQLYSQQEAQYGQQYADQQEGQYDQQYMEQNANQYEQHYEDYQQQGEKNSQLLSEGQQVRECRQGVQCEEVNEGLSNKEDAEKHHDQMSEELVQGQQYEVQEENAGDFQDGRSFEDGACQEQMKVCGATQGDLGEENIEGGTSGTKEEKTPSKVVEGKAHDSNALPKQSDISSDLTEPSSSGNVRQYRQLLGEIGDPEQSDMDELELQLAALVDSQVGEECGKQVQQSAPSGVKMAKQAASAAVNEYDSTLSTESSKHMEKLANRTVIKISEGTGHGGTAYDNPEAQSKIPQTSSKPENEPAVIPKEADTVKIIQPSVPRSGSRKLPGLTKMLESDTESLQLDATISNEDSDDFDFSSDK